MSFMLGLQLSKAQIVPIQLFDLKDYSGQVNCIFQDQMGFIWFGKETGLYRYDGHELRSYKANLNDSTSISSDNILSISEDPSGNLWVGTRSGGLNCLDRKTGKFTRFMHDEANPNSISFNEIHSILSDATGNLWIGTDGGGFDYFDKETRKFTAFKVGKSTGNGLTSNKILHIASQGNGNYWLGTWSGGLHLFNSKTKKSKLIGKGTPYENSNIYFIKEVKPGLLWLSTDNKGLIAYNIELNTFSTIIPSAPIQYLWDICATDKGEVYVASNKGLFYFSSLEAVPSVSFEFRSITTLLLDKSQMLWLGNKNGMIGKIIPYLKQFHSFEPLAVYNNSPVSSMCVDNNSTNIYFSSYNYFIEYNPITKTINATSFPSQPWISISSISGSKNEFVIASSTIGLRTYKNKTNVLKTLKFEENIKTIF